MQNWTSQLPIKKSVLFEHHDRDVLTIRDPWSWGATIPSILEKEKLRTIWYTNIAGWNIPMFNRKYIFKRSIFHCHVSLPECIPFSCQCQTPMKSSTKCKIQMLKRTLFETCNRHVAIYKILKQKRMFCIYINLHKKTPC